jgi:hypothetical protein
MATFEVVSPEGTKFKVNAPDGATQEDAIKYVQENMYQPAKQSINDRMKAVEPPNWFERQLAKLPDIISPKTESNIRGFSMGAADPSVGAAQLIANALGQGSGMNKAIQAKEQAYETDKALAGRDGVDASRIVGNIASPVNLLVASRAAPAVNTLQRIGQGLKSGAIGGAFQPVTNGGDEFWTDKAIQTGVGAGTGAVLNPILGKVGDVFLRRGIAGPRASLKTDEIVNDAMSSLGPQAQEVTAPQLQQLRQQVMQGLEKGQKIDAAALLRQNDFKDLGIEPTLGQITRDPTQFARERNLRGVSGVGEPLMNRFEQQNQQIQSVMSQLKGSPSEAYPAGKKISDALSSYDEGLRKNVSSLYSAARETAGKDAEVPLQGLAQNVADIFDRYRTDVPAGLRGQFAKYGLDPSEVVNQRKMFTVEEADKLLKEINKHGGSKSTLSALDELRTAVKNAVTQDAGVEDVFSGARKAAAERFKLQDAIPALRAASNGETAPDDFVRKFVINGKTEDVQKLAGVLSKTEPSAYQEAKDQIGNHLVRAAFGENLSGDKLPAPERLAKAIRDIGSDKLQAFYTPADIAKLKQVARVSAYMNTIPAGSPVNSSNTAGAVMNLLSRIPGIPGGLGLLNSVKNAATNVSAVNTAMKAAPVASAVQVQPEQAALLAKLLGAGGFAAGGLLGGAPGK